jgi:MFS family permease
MDATIKMENVSAMGETLERKPAVIEWKQLLSLTSLYASVIIGWIAYYRYQPKLLVEFRFTDFSFLLMVVQGVILVVTPLIAGRFGDRYRFKNGHRLPIISSGISFAAMIFMAVAFTLISNPGEVFRWVLPVLIVLWLIAMSIFTSPALSTMELFTPVEKLPMAMAILTIVANLLYALEPVIVDIIDYLGASLTFITGGVVVFASGYALKKNSMGLFMQGKADTKRPMATFKLDTQKSEYGFIFFMGVAVGLSTAVLFNIFPGVLGSKLSSFVGNTNSNILIAGVLIVSALVSWPASKMVNAYGLKRSFWTSFIVTIISMSAVLLIETPAVVFCMAFVFAISFAALSVSSLPLSIRKSNYYEKVFCVGIFFSGSALPDAFLDIIKLL